MKRTKRYQAVIGALVFIALLSFQVNSKAQNIISLAGKWSFELDPDSLGYKENWSEKHLSSDIQLPGTTDEAGYGTVTKGSDYGILTRAHKYVGAAWYQKKITIPAGWNNKNVNLFLERVLWESKVYVDGKEVSTLSPLYVAHKHPLGRLTKGTHIITLCINNELVHNIGDKGHGYSEYTQSIWNGVIGRIELQKQEDLAINAVKTYPDVSAKSLRLEAFVMNWQQKKSPLVLTATLTDKQSGKVIRTQKQNFIAKAGEAKYDIILNQLSGIKTWDEFDPALYQVTLQLKSGLVQSQWTDVIGFRKLGTTAHKILVNDKVSYIRGNLDCVHFPITGYPSTLDKDWEKIFQKYKDYGLNTVRFHSWCPPEVAFRVADRMGIYIQAEVLWIDWWMSQPNPDRPEMDTRGFPQGLGKNPDGDKFVQEEMKRIVDTYGNHPSFLFFCIGNELGNSDFTVMQEWIRKVKKEDPRRLYAVSTARKITEVDDYMVTHNIPGVGGTYGNSINKTDAGLEKNYSKATIPIIAHEVGQYPVYPEWKEIDKYKGVLKARNLEGFKEMAKKNGIVSQDVDFHKASGALQQLLYKNLIENVLLAPSSAGFQLLSMQDYQGQGEALIGWLDAFWDDKGITDPKVFRQHSNAVVPLIRINSFTFTQSDTIKLSMEVANYFKNDVNAKLNWQLTDELGNVIRDGTAAASSFPQGTLTAAGQLNIECLNLPAEAKKYTFSLHLAGTTYSNSWPLYVFPKEQKNTANDIYVATEWNAKVDSVLNGGGKVLLIANKLGTKNTSKAVSFTPLFWSSSFFPGQGNETLGSLINVQSGAFKNFPTDNYASWQWYKAGSGAKYFDLSAMPEAFKPLVQPISDFHYNKKLGSIFETQAGAGKLLVCGYDLTKSDNAYLQQLRYSLIHYMQGNEFNPVMALPKEKLKEIVAKVPTAENQSPLPDQFNNAILYINAGKKSNSTRSDWSNVLDEVVVNKGFTYEVAGAKVYKEKETGSWIAKRMNINIAPPNGIKGYVYLHFNNPAQSKTSGIVSLEGRELAIGKIPVSGKWVKIFMMREDTNDGKLNINITSDGAANIEIDKLVVVPED
ncbi:glycoside hydrolase family 2 [Pedobacter sp. HDW13]|uniref:sugar-binding domain-containing protein n=1 Tax=Pedobacter sp. HDW13 TaxID=2714940 RepID=UPI0014087104|nr:sugar-binding domain-containing protein [Pedobacter sp. HDW13]QIL40293.1 glycoside hydrolase family 2 [Pedobacter sp. HDW13]